MRSHVAGPVPLAHTQNSEPLLLVGHSPGIGAFNNNPLMCQGKIEKPVHHRTLWGSSSCFLSSRKLATIFMQILGSLEKLLRTQGGKLRPGLRNACSLTTC